MPVCLVFCRKQFRFTYLSPTELYRFLTANRGVFNYFVYRSHELSKENPHQILVIEDQVLNRKVVRIVLQSEGYDVLEATNADEALMCLEQDFPALILMDIALPGQSGEELTRQIKANPTWCDIPIIALTAAAMTGDRERILRSGCDDYLSKPIDTQVLAKRVAYHLKEARHDH